ncbi:MAG TPA: Holliday junction resolvase RuvX [Candidatus Methylacidiphilales bacterium]|nr:Holliday junction resolvase RuvX [Candidatus Methylacidiphilales bacterium]
MSNKSATPLTRRYTPPMRILAIDYGAKRIGLALSDPTATLARPLPFLPARPDAPLAREIALLAKKEDARLILLGLPRHMNGSLGEAAVRVQAFALLLGQATSVPVRLIDERLSTVQAGRQLHEAGRNARQQRAKIDSEAAAVLLQGYLDSQPSSLPLPPDA